MKCDYLMSKQILGSHSIRFHFRIVLLACLALAASGCNWITLLSVNSNGAQGDDTSSAPVLSYDARYIVFDSRASNLVPDDSGNYGDVFIRDTATGTTARVSVDSEGNEGNGLSRYPAISADGRYVAFESYASNLVPNDTSNGTDIFVHDTLGGITTRVNVDSAGNPSNGWASSPDISADGRYVAFSSGATNLVPNDTNGADDIFVHDRNTAVTTRISVDSAGNQATGSSRHVDLSADGRYVAFTSTAPNLAPGDNNNDSEYDKDDVFVHDRQTGSTRRASLNNAGVGWLASSYAPSVSDNGRFVAYLSNSNTRQYTCCRRTDVYVHDMEAGSNQLASISSDGNGPNNMSGRPYISSSGRYVTYSSDASNLVPDDTNAKDDIFVHDRLTGMTSRVSLNAAGEQANGDSFYGRVSANERYVAFAGGASNLADGDVNGKWDVFLRALHAVTVTSVTPNHFPVGATTAATFAGTNFLPGAEPAVQNAKVSNIVVVDENTITADVFVKSNTPTGAQDVFVFLFGTGAGVFSGATGVCAKCATFQ